MAESFVLFDPEVIMNPHPSYHNECKNSTVWDNWYPRLRVAIFAIFLVYYVLIVPFLFVFARRRTAKARTILKFYTYVPAIVFMFLWLLIGLIADSFLNCLRISDLKYMKIYVAANIFRILAEIIMLGIVALNVTPVMMKHAGFKTNLAQVGQSLLFALVCLFGFIHAIFWNYNNIHAITGEKIVDPKTGVTATFVTLYFVSTLTAVVHIFASCLKSKRSNRSLQGIFPYAGLLAFSLLIFAIVEMIVVFGYYIDTRLWTKSTSAGYGIVSLFFQACVFGLICMLAKSPALERDEAGHDEKTKLSNNRDSMATIGTGVEQPELAQA